MKKIKMNLLFVCESNRMRSPTAERLINESKKNKAKSCGTWKDSKKVVNQKLINWADLIFTMDVFQKCFIKENFICDKEIINLKVPDMFQRDDPQLIKLFKKELKSYL